MEASFCMDEGFPEENMEEKMKTRKLQPIPCATPLKSKLLDKELCPTIIYFIYFKPSFLYKCACFKLCLKKEKCVNKSCNTQTV